MLPSGEGSGTPLQYSCLENPMDAGAWKAAVHGVAEGRTRLSDFTFNFHFPLSCIGEGNGNPLQCCCLENPRDGGAWWAAVYGVARSRTQLKWLSSSSSIFFFLWDSCVWVESHGPLVVVLVILMKIGYICPYSSTLGVIRFNTYSFLKDSPHNKKKGIDYWNRGGK